MSPELLIDGYNLMHAAGIAKKVARPGELERWRHRLIKRVAQNLKPAERATTIIVFDAKGSSDLGSHHELLEGIRIEYPERGHEADELLEQLIADHKSPQRLRVVSSDHRVQKAARRRHAKFLDSDVFLDELDDRQQGHAPEKPETIPRPPTRPRPLANPTAPQARPQPIKPEQGDADFWLKEFGEIEVEPLGDVERPKPDAPKTKSGSRAVADRGVPIPNPLDPRFAPDDIDAPAKPIDPVLGDADFWQRRIDELRKE